MIAQLDLSAARKRGEASQHMELGLDEENMSARCDSMVGNGIGAR